MKREYATKEELSKVDFVIWTMILFVGILFLIQIVIFGGGENSVVGRLKNLENFVASQYNFTGDECIEWETKSQIEGECISTSTFECGFTDKPEIQKKACSKYCHTEKSQIGEECKTVQKLIIIELPSIEECNRCFNNSSLGVSCTLLRCSEIRETVMNETVCIPKYENVPVNCVSGDVVREARKLVE